MLKLDIYFYIWSQYHYGDTIYYKLFVILLCSLHASAINPSEQHNSRLPCISAECCVQPICVQAITCTCNVKLTSCRSYDSWVIQCIVTHLWEPLLARNRIFVGCSNGAVLVFLLLCRVKYDCFIKTDGCENWTADISLFFMFNYRLCDVRKNSFDA